MGILQFSEAKQFLTCLVRLMDRSMYFPPFGANVGLKVKLLHFPGLSKSSKSGSPLSTWMVGFQSSGGPGGDHPGGTPNNVDLEVTSSLHTRPH